MKKIMSLLLTVTMLLTMIPSIIVNVSAAEVVNANPTGSKTLSLPENSYVIPVPIRSATLNGQSYDVSNILLDNADNGNRIQNNAVTSFEMIGYFVEPTTVSSFIIKGSDTYAQRCKLNVSFRKEGTEEWVSIQPHGLSGGNGQYITYTMPDSLADQKFVQVKLTNVSGATWLWFFGAAFFTKTEPATAWSASGTLSLPADANVIPITVTSASTTTNTNSETGAVTELDWKSVPLDSLGTDYEYNGTNYGRYFQNIDTTSTPFEMIGTFAEPTTVSGFIIRTNGSYVQRSQIQVAFRKAGTEQEEWVTINAHRLTGGMGQYVACDISNLNDLFGEQLFDQVKLTKANGWLEFNGALFFTQSESGLHSVSTAATDSSNTFASAWGYSNESQLSKAGVTGTMHSAIARLSTPTEIHSVKMTLSYHSARANGSTVWASVDGEHWDQLSSFVEVAANTVNTAACTTATTATKAYNYVKVEQASAKAGTYWSLVSIAVYGWARTEGDYVPATATDDSNQNLAPAWTANNTVRVSDSSSDAPVSTIAKLEYSTVINEITFKTGANGNRARQSTIYGSVDGNEWTQIAKMGGGLLDNMLYTISISSEDAFNYVKVEQSSNLKGYDWSAVRIAVYGESFDGISMEGYQTKEDSTTYSVRFVSTVKGLDYQSVGYRITATGDGVDKSWDVNDNTVYSALYETVDGETNIVNADEGCYFYIADVTNISIANYGEITFTVTPYVILTDGTSELTGQSATYVFEDGVAIPQA